MLDVRVAGHRCGSDQPPILVTNRQARGVPPHNILRTHCTTFGGRLIDVGPWLTGKCKGVDWEIWIHDDIRAPCGEERIAGDGQLNLAREHQATALGRRPVAVGGLG